MTVRILFFKFPIKISDWLIDTVTNWCRMVYNIHSIQLDWNLWLSKIRMAGIDIQDFDHKKIRHTSWMCTKLFLITIRWATVAFSEQTGQISVSNFSFKWLMRNRTHKKIYSSYFILHKVKDRLSILSKFVNLLSKTNNNKNNLWDSCNLQKKTE